MDERGRRGAGVPEESGRDDQVRGAKRQAKADAGAIRMRRVRAIVLSLVGILVVVVGYNVSVVSEQNQQVSRAAALAVSPEKTIAPPFATVAGTGIMLHLPALLENVIGLGYHQAYNQRSVAFDSTMGLRENATTVSITRTSRPGAPVAFLMASRGRGSAPTSSVDIAVNNGTIIRSPVSGRIRKVTSYMLYGRYDDVRIEIEPDGHSDIFVAIVHLDQPRVSVGERVEAGLTPLARPRPLPIGSQIDQYLGKASEHIHVQVNPVEGDEVIGDASAR